MLDFKWTNSLIRNQLDSILNEHLHFTEQRLIPSEFHIVTDSKKPKGIKGNKISYSDYLIPI